MPQSVVLETVNDLIQHLRDPLIGLPVILGLGLLILLSPLLTDPYGFNKYPGPLAAKVSRLWLARAAGKGDRYATVHKLHKKHGKFLRIAPDHISIADHRAIPIVYGHGTGFIKSDFYDAFVSIRRGLFNTRDRQEHTRKRKIVSHVFSQKNVLSFEQHIHTVIHELFGKWDQLCDQAIKHPEASSKFKGQATMDILNWTNFFAFDVIGSLAFGKPFGMVSSAKDIAPVQLENSTKTIYLPAIQILNTRGEFSATTGCIPPALRPYAKKLPWFKRGVQSVGQLAGIAIAAVKERLENPGVGAEREDLLSKLQAGKDENGNPMGREELTAEALTQLIAGSDTTSNSSCAIFYYLSNNPSVITTLRAELDSVAEEKGGPDSFLDFDYEDLKSLPYLQACIDEALRIHSTSAIGLPRIVPEGGAEVCGKWFPGGTTLSVPAYTVHRDPEVWGNDPDAYRPERWFEQNKEKMAASFIPFSFGPRSCVGRNLASMELLLIIASTVYRYDITPMYPGKPLNTIEGFLRKPTEFDVAMKRRVFS